MSGDAEPPTFDSLTIKVMQDDRFTFVGTSTIEYAVTPPERPNPPQSTRQPKL
jgi:hypothetical protein